MTDQERKEWFIEKLEQAEKGDFGYIIAQGSHLEYGRRVQDNASRRMINLCKRELKRLGVPLEARK